MATDQHELVHQNHSGLVPWYKDFEESMARITFSLPYLLKEKLDKLVARKVWTTRSEALRYALVSVLTEMQEV